MSLFLFFAYLSRYIHFLQVFFFFMNSSLSKSVKNTGSSKTAQHIMYDICTILVYFVNLSFLQGAEKCVLFSFMLSTQRPCKLYRMVKIRFALKPICIYRIWVWCYPRLAHINVSRFFKGNGQTKYIVFNLILHLKKKSTNSFNTH